MNLHNKTAVVTGGARGIGEAIVEQLATAGATVVFIDVDADNVRERANTLVAKGLSVEGVVGDVTKKTDMESLIEDAHGKSGHLDILVNCAGINRDSMLHKMTDEQWEEVLTVDLTGCFYTTRRALQLMRAQERGGSIISISSSSWLGSLGQANYAAAKAGIVGLTLTAAREGGRYGVRANVICPGFIDTSMTRALPAETYEAVVARIPMGHAGDPADVAGLVAFLGDDMAKYITGQVIYVGGGLVW